MWISPIFGLFLLPPFWLRLKSQFNRFHWLFHQPSSWTQIIKPFQKLLHNCNTAKMCSFAHNIHLANICMNYKSHCNDILFEWTAKNQFICLVVHSINRTLLFHHFSSSIPSSNEWMMQCLMMFISQYTLITWNKYRAFFVNSLDKQQRITLNAELQKEIALTFPHWMERYVLTTKCLLCFYVNKLLVELLTCIFCALYQNKREREKKNYEQLSL